MSDAGNKLAVRVVEDMLKVFQFRLVYAPAGPGDA